MLRYAWHNTDASFSHEELLSDRPAMVKDVQFDVNAQDSCEVDECDSPAFIRCSHCGKLMCLSHFLDRKCFHEPSQNMSVPYEIHTESSQSETEIDDDDDGDDLDLSLMDRYEANKRGESSSCNVNRTQKPRSLKLNMSKILPNSTVKLTYL